MPDEIVSPSEILAAAGAERPVKGAFLATHWIRSGRLRRSARVYRDDSARREMDLLDARATGYPAGR
jgi:hypothetical protein